MFEDLNLNPCRKEDFEAIKKNFPELEEKYKNLSKEFWFEKEKKIELLPFEDYQKESKFILSKIINGDISHGNIFVLARTNKQLLEFSKKNILVFRS